MIAAPVTVGFLNDDMTVLREFIQDRAKHAVLRILCIDQNGYFIGGIDIFHGDLSLDVEEAYR
jgi:hypothetical protein